MAALAALAVYLDGSSELVHGVRIGGFGLCSDAGLSFSSPLLVHDPQTNIRAELWAALWALRRDQPGVREVFCSDCNLVFLGVTGGGAARWKRHGWRNASGPVSHVDIWEEVLGLCLRFVGEVCWLKVPAHYGVPGNEDADTLANEGRLDSPLYLLPLAAGGVTRSSDEDEVAWHMIWLRTNPFWNRWRGWSPWRNASTTTRTWTGGGYGEGEVPGERPCTPPPLYPRDFWSPVSVSSGPTSLPRLASQTLNF